MFARQQQQQQQHVYRLQNSLILTQQEYPDRNEEQYKKLFYVCAEHYTIFKIRLLLLI